MSGRYSHYRILYNSSKYYAPLRKSRTRAARKQLDFSGRWQDRLGMSEWTMPSNGDWAAGPSATAIGLDAID